MARRIDVRRHPRHLRSGRTTDVSKHTRRARARKLGEKVVARLEKVYRKPAEKGEEGEGEGRTTPSSIPAPRRPEALGGPRVVSGMELPSRELTTYAEPERVKHVEGLPSSVSLDEPIRGLDNPDVDVVSAIAGATIDTTEKEPKKFAWNAYLTIWQLPKDEGIDRDEYEYEMQQPDQEVVASGSAETAGEVDSQIWEFVSWAYNNTGCSNADYWSDMLYFGSESTNDDDVQELYETMLEKYPDVPLSRYLKGVPGQFGGFSGYLHIEKTGEGQARVTGEIIDNDSDTVVDKFAKDVTHPEDIKSIKEDFEKKAKDRYKIETVEVSWGEGTDKLRADVTKPSPKGLESMRPKAKAPELGYGGEKSKEEYVAKTKKLIDENIPAATLENIDKKVTLIEARIDYLKQKKAAKEAAEIEQYFRGIEKARRTELEKEKPPKKGKKYARIMVDTRPDDPGRYRIRMKLEDGAVTEADFTPEGEHQNLELEQQLVAFRERLESRPEEIVIPEVEWTPEASRLYKKIEFSERQHDPNYGERKGKIEQHREWIAGEVAT